MAVTVRKRGKKSWLVTAHQGGKRTYWTVHSEHEAKMLSQMVRSKELAGANIVESIKTARTAMVATTTTTFPKLGEALGEWIDAQVASKALRSATAKCYGHALKAYTAPHQLADGRVLGEVPVNEVTRPMLGEVLTKLRNRGVSQSALCHVRNPLKKYFENLVEIGSLVTSPAADLKHFMGRQRRKRTALSLFTEKEGPVLLGAAKEFYPRWHAFIMTSLLAGLRWGEVAALQRGDIDFKRGRLHVQRTVSGANEIEAPKDHESRHVKAPKALLAALEAHLWAMGEDASAKDWTPEQRTWVFPTERGKPITYRCFHTIWIDVLKHAKLAFRRYHSTRHTYATWSLENGGDIRFVQQQLGHSSIKQTVDCYGHLQADKHEHTVEALNALVK